MNCAHDDCPCPPCAAERTVTERFADHIGTLAAEFIANYGIDLDASDGNLSEILFDDILDALSTFLVHHAKARNVVRINVGRNRK